MVDGRRSLIIRDGSSTQLYHLDKIEFEAFMARLKINEHRNALHLPSIGEVSTGRTNGTTPAANVSSLGQARNGMDSKSNLASFASLPQGGSDSQSASAEVDESARSTTQMEQFPTTPGSNLPPGSGRVLSTISAGSESHLTVDRGSLKD